MSLLRENSVTFSQATNETIAHVVSTDAVQFVAPKASAEAGLPAYTLGAGEYGEIALQGEYLVGAPSYLYLTVNGQHYKVALEPWIPVPP